MWLLRTDCAETKWFNSPEDVPAPGYAILSHVWDKKEQTFQNTLKLPEDCDEKERAPRYQPSVKIRAFCSVAKRDGYQWAWADTCCIDKSSSAELSEAINSMYEYYAHARVCYVILADVSHRNRQPNVLDDKDDCQEFLWSKWHTRGWTLQELIAPDIVVFLDADWHVVGTKAKLAKILVEATGIPEDVLTLKREPSAVSIAGRMSWASRRKTTRVEDEAYCLMGIFGISMPTLYGEGRAAFVRLQEEIMRQSNDISLFIWGFRGVAPYSDLSRYQHSSHNPASALLAPEVSEFGAWSTVRFVPDQRPEGMPPGLLTFTPSAHGILSYIPVIKQGNCVVGGLLLCMGEQTLIGNYQIVLILTECPDTTSPLGPLYDVGGTQYLENCRLFVADVSSNEFKSQHFTIEWQHIYIAHRPPSRTANPQLILLNHALFPSFQIPLSPLISYFNTKINLSLSAPGGPMLILVPGPRTYVDGYLALRFGCCTTSTAARQGPSSAGIPWARLSYHSRRPSASDWNIDDHDCHQDHILKFDQVYPVSEGYTDGPYTRVYRFRLWYMAVDVHIRLSFSPSPHDPTLLVLTEILLSGLRPDYSGDAIKLSEDGDIFWKRKRFQLTAAFGTSSASEDAHSGGVDGSPGPSSRAVESVASIEEHSLAGEGQGDGDGGWDERGAWSGDEDQQQSREDEHEAWDGICGAQGIRRHLSGSQPPRLQVEQDRAVDNVDHGLQVVDSATTIDLQPLTVDGQDGGEHVGHRDEEASAGDRELRQAHGKDIECPAHNRAGTRQEGDRLSAESQPACSQPPCAEQHGRIEYPWTEPVDKESIDFGGVPLRLVLTNPVGGDGGLPVDDEPDHCRDNDESEDDSKQHVNDGGRSDPYVYNDSDSPDSQASRSQSPRPDKDAGVHLSSPGPRVLEVVPLLKEHPGMGSQYDGDGGGGDRQVLSDDDCSDARLGRCGYEWLERDGRRNQHNEDGRDVEPPRFQASRPPTPWPEENRDVNGSGPSPRAAGSVLAPCSGEQSYVWAGRRDGGGGKPDEACRRVGRQRRTRTDRGQRYEGRDYSEAGREPFQSQEALPTTLHIMVILYVIFCLILEAVRRVFQGRRRTSEAR